MTETIAFGGLELVLDPSGLIYVPSQRLVIVADLHLEKGAAFARRGTMLPPYDSQATLERLAKSIKPFAPTTLISLGDGFHDTAGARLITGVAADLLDDLCSRVQWCWIKGNHDHELPSVLPGTVCDTHSIGQAELRHEPSLIKPDHLTKSLIAGHLHPKARVRNRRRSISRPCFVWSDQLMILPAFGSFTGGLNVLEPPIHSLLPKPSIALLGEDRIFKIGFDNLAPEPSSLGRVRQLA